MKETNEISEKEISVMERYGLSFEALQDCSLLSYSFGENVISEGAANEKLLIVTDGRAKVGVIGPNGKNLVLCFYVSEGLLGEAELFSDMAVGSTSVTALENFCCIAIPIEGNREYLNGNLGFSRTAAAELAKKLLRSTQNIMESTLYSSEVRLCRYILAASEGGYFRDIMTDVAYSVGISYRHLYRTIGTLCKNGILKKTTSGYRICDPEELKKRSKQQ